MKRTGGVRILVCRLPVKSPWLNPIEPRWLHGKRAIVEPERTLTADELMDRVHQHFRCEHLELLHQHVLRNCTRCACWRWARVTAKHKRPFCGAHEPGGAKRLLIRRVFRYGPGDPGVTQRLDIMGKKLDVTMALCGQYEIARCALAFSQRHPGG